MRKSNFKKVLLLLVLLLTFTWNMTYAMPSVYLDAGHGGAETGTYSYDRSVIEKELNLKTALSCKEELEKHGVEIKISRDADIYVDLLQRSLESNEYAPSCFVSIHHNGFSDSSVNRGLVIYQLNDDDSKKLADAISPKLKDVGNQEVKIITREDDTGDDYYSVLRETEAPAVLVEVSFITSEYGLSLVNSDDKCKRNGQLIAQGILDYLGIDYSKTNGIVKSSKKSSNGLKLIYDTLNRKHKVEILETDKTKNRDILCEPTASQYQCERWLKNKNASEEFSELLPFIYSESVKYGVNPTLVVAQIALESAYMTSDVCKDFNNVSGIKDRNDSSTYAYYDTYENGITAEICHLSLYAGKPIDGYYYSAMLDGWCTDVDGLTFTWAEDPFYSQKLNLLMTEIEETEDLNTTVNVTKSNTTDKIYEILKRDKNTNNAKDLLDKILNKK